MSVMPPTTHWTLATLLEGIVAVAPADDRPVSGIALDSRQVGPGDLFLALRGLKSHGGRFAADAVARGAVAVLLDEGVEPPAELAVPVWPVVKLGRRVGQIAARFHADPSASMPLVGITGTNGKSSCAHYIAQVFAAEGIACGQIGTLGHGVNGALEPQSNTTPDAVQLQGLLAGFRDQGVQRVAMEVSSHALDQYRVDGTHFDVAVFTNLTRDHLDYHGDMPTYARAKERLFHMPGLRRAVVNLDDPWGRRFVESIPAGVAVTGYGLAAEVDAPAALDERVVGSDVVCSRQGLHFRVAVGGARAEVISPLYGRFNVANLLAVLAVLLDAGVPLARAAQRLAALHTVPGRMEAFGGGAGQPLAVVDYAHTPDALSQALKALREHIDGRIWCVFGCGGERDRGKRPLMGAAAEAGADRVIVTNDNPRSEDPYQIIEEILAGMQYPDDALVVPERGEAIAAGLAGAHANDVILVAGKGHETVQCVGDRCRPFSDRETVQRLLQEGWR